MVEKSNPKTITEYISVYMRLKTNPDEVKFKVPYDFAYDRIAKRRLIKIIGPSTTNFITVDSSVTPPTRAYLVIHSTINQEPHAAESDYLAWAPGDNYNPPAYEQRQNILEYKLWFRAAGLKAFTVNDDIWIPIRFTLIREYD